MNKIDRYLNIINPFRYFQSLNDNVISPKYNQSISTGYYCIAIAYAGIAGIVVAYILAFQVAATRFGFGNAANILKAINIAIAALYYGSALTGLAACIVGFKSRRVLVCTAVFIPFILYVVFTVNIFYRF